MRDIASRLLLVAVGASCAGASAFAQIAPSQTQEPLIPGLPNSRLMPPDTTLQPNVQPAPTPTLGYPTFNPFRRPIRTDPLGPWQITPRLEARETFDSNPTGAPRGATRPDGFSSLLPGVNISHQSDRNTFVLDYQAEGRKYYSDQDLDQIRNNLSEFSTTRVLEELLFVDTRANIGQALINQRGAVSATPQLQSANETEYYDFLLSPYLRNHFGGFADTELRYSLADSTFKNSAGGQLPSSLTNQVSGTVNSGADFARELWSLNGLYANTDRSGLSSSILAPQFATRDLNAPATRGTISAGVEYAVTRQYSVLGTVGYESIHDPTLVHNIDDPTWSGGFRLRPGPNTNLLLTYGFRDGEHFWQGNATYDYDPGTRFVARYSEGLVTVDTLMQSSLGALGVDEFGNFIDPVTRQQFDPTASLFSLTSLSFRQKRFDSTFHAVRQVNYFDLLLYNEDRTTQVTQTSDSSYGVTASWGRDLNALTNAFVEFRYQHIKFQPDQRVDHNYGFTLGVRYALTPTIDTYANYSYFTRDSQPSTNNLDDHVMFVGIRKLF
ncbi:MAG: TIGR03016 family PEP-CTERM system-associated outer membrane protein [Pseudomonadota bacterium]